MEIISANKLGQLAIENKKQFEQLLPELVKRLILVSNHDVRYLRTPSRDDVWAPGFDGIVETENNSRFVCAGRSVWEFGTSSDSLEKINSDYEKRTKDSLGVVPSETSFYLVMPKIWAYKKKSLTEWENERKEWKKVSVYDASILCDWINSEPTVCAWLLEQIDSDGNLDFCTVHKAWERFSNLTNPKFCTKMFLTGREDQISSFFRNCSNRIIRVKAQSLVDSRGFVLASLLSNRELCEKTIVIYNEKTYRVISSMVKDKLIFLNFPFDGEVDDNNNTIIPLNCEATNEADVEVIPLTKTEYMAALKEMTNSDYEPHDLFAFSHGNLRALIRRIPGYIIESRPDWSKIPDVSLLIPLVFLRVVDIDCDKELVEKLSGKPYLTVLDKYNELLSLEDSPIKKVNRKYVIVNYEEAWDVLNLSVADYHYSLLEDAIHFLFEEIIRNGFLHSQKGRYYSRNPLFYNLFLNLIYFQEEGSQNLEINQTVRKILARTEEPRLANIIIENLSLLAEASPKEVMDFISSDMAKENSLIISLFGNNEYDHSYCQVLYALEELARNSETIVEACRIMFLLHEKAYSYSINNVPEDSLLNALCLINNEGTATLAQKKAILIKLMKKNGRIAADIVLKAAFKDSYYRGVRIGEKPLRGEKISAKQFFDCQTAH